ncbi:DoxX family protein [Halomonas beimenensis]|uniref:INTEGRAL MEMBRANE PROTEIN (Rhomboid family) n=1 Tax=Halomonas beimenensis TaxID=475662 RepID=A0A291PAI4_9GAMM|nr:DoxX family protein [Halomonas beimenensis]ATJ83910.1 INTEGRAL MEMBRANE PROTEIN (Rhomboid family) [Halomonas beimenensis]
MKALLLPLRFYYHRLAPGLDRVPFDPVALLMRVVLGSVFFGSALTKVEGFALSQSTFFLFEHEYALPLLPPVLAAYLATLAEFGLSLLLWAGLATRLAATGLLVMTLVIQTFVYPDAWVTHGLWAASLLTLVLRGPGALSLDRLLAGWLDRHAPGAKPTRPHPRG